jgi:hypothetical protein
MMERRAFLKAIGGVAALAAMAGSAVAAPLVVNNPAENLPRPEERKPAVDTDGRIGGARVEKVQWGWRRRRYRRWGRRRWRRMYWRPVRRRRWWRRRRVYYW